MKRSNYFFAILIVGVAVWFAGNSFSGLPPGEVLYETDSLYHHVRVTEVSGYRYLSFDRTRGSQSAVNVKNPYELKFAYTRAMFIALAFLHREPENVLFVGLGGASIPRVFAKHFPNTKIDIAEIDEEVVNVAKKYFFFSPTGKMNIHIQDGRQFLRRSNEQYDMIFLDAYNNEAIPFHLTTKEFFDIVKQRIKPDGIVASNVWGPRSNQFYLSQIKTFQEVFPTIYLIDTVTTNNYIFINSNQPIQMNANELHDKIFKISNEKQFEFNVREFARTLEDLKDQQVNADILLDDFAPVDALRNRKAGTQ